MFIIKYYILGAALCLISAYYMPYLILQLLLLWLSLSLTLVSFAYTFDMPSIFRKTQDGKISTWIRWAFIPFLMGARAYNAWARCNDTVPPIQNIQSNLFISRRLFESDLEELSRNNIDCIVDVTAEFVGVESAMTDRSFDYLTIPTLDHKVPSLRKLQHALHWIDVQISLSRSVVIHCALGRGRSVFVVAAYLLSKDDTLSVEEVLEQLNQVRSTAQLNRSQIKVLHAIKSKSKFKLADPTWLIVNPVSGAGKWRLHKQELLRELTKKHRLRIHETTEKLSAKEITEQALSAGVEEIIVGGGDGTVTEVAHQLIHQNTLLGIIPLGTANALCHVLYGVTTKFSPVKNACNAINSGKVRKIDTAQCNEQTILLLLGIGFEQKMIEHAHREEKNAQGQFAYLTGFFNAAISDSTQALNISFDHQDQQTIQANSLVVANIAPFSSVLAHGGKTPEVDDGKLHVSSLDAADTLSERFLALSDITLSSLGVKERASIFSHETVEHVEISADQAINYVIDGENFSSEKLVIKINPESLNIYVPATP